MRCSRLKTSRFARDFLLGPSSSIFFILFGRPMLSVAVGLYFGRFLPVCVCPWAEKSPKTSVLYVWLIGVILVVLRRKYVLLLFCSEKKRALGRTHCLKITQNVAFEFWRFPPIFGLLKLTCLVTLFDRKLQVFKNSPKWTIFGIFN